MMDRSAISDKDSLSEKLHMITKGTSRSDRLYHLIAEAAKEEAWIGNNWFKIFLICDDQEHQELMSKFSHDGFSCESSKASEGHLWWKIWGYYITLRW